MRKSITDQKLEDQDSQLFKLNLSQIVIYLWLTALSLSTIGCASSPAKKAWWTCAGADIISTQIALNNGFRETNPLAPDTEDTALSVAIQLVLKTIQYVTTDQTEKVAKKKDELGFNIQSGINCGIAARNAYLIAKD